MKKSSWFETLMVEDHISRKSEELEKERILLESNGRAALEEVTAAAEDDIWTKYQAFERGRIVHSKNLPELLTAYQQAMDRKLRPESEHWNKRERIRRAEEELMATPIADATELIERQIEKNRKRYVCNIPTYRQTASGRELPVEKVDPVTQVRWLDISTNSDSVVEAERVLMAARAKAFHVLTISELKQTLDEAEEKILKLNFDARQVSVKRDDFDRLDHAKTWETAFIIPQAKSALS